jgi:hypothetical protein
MSDHKAVLGSAAWVQQTHGWMTAAERRSLVGPSQRTHAARKVAEDTLTPTLLHHSYRTYRFGRALGELDGLQVDAELLFAQRSCTTPAW